MKSIDGTIELTEASFRSIPQFPRANYRVTQPWDGLEQWISRQTDQRLDLNPDFQRAHVWTREQQIAYVEYKLRGGESGSELYFNHPGWMGDWKGDFVIVDGKQRLEAVRAFLRNDVPAFGFFHNEFKGPLGMTGPCFNVNIACLKSRSELLRWYLAINSGGTPHAPAEIEKVRAMIGAVR